MRACVSLFSLDLCGLVSSYSAFGCATTDAQPIDISVFLPSNTLDSRHRAYAIACSNDGKIWLGGDGVCVFDRNANMLFRTLKGTSVNGIAFDSNGDVYLASADSQCILIVNSQGEWRNTIGERKTEREVTSMFGYPVSVAVDWLGHMFVCDAGNHSVSAITQDGAFLLSAGNRNFFHPSNDNNGHFASPRCVALSPVGEVLVADRWNNRVQIFTNGLKFVRKFYVTDPHGIAFDSEGNTIVTSIGTSQIMVFRPSAGTTDPKASLPITTFSYAPISTGYSFVESLAHPSGVCVDVDGSILVAGSRGNVFAFGF